MNTFEIYTRKQTNDDDDEGLSASVFLPLAAPTTTTPTTAAARQASLQITLFQAMCFDRACGVR